MTEETFRVKHQRLVAERQANKQRADLERTNAILADEDGRRAADAARTAKLRELRLAKEAAEREVAKPSKGRHK